MAFDLINWGVKNDLVKHLDFFSWKKRINFLRYG